ncbi:GEVED domain-containing protein [Flavobacterium poyangense]
MNGFITFGNTFSSSTEYSPISSGTGYSGAISALGWDLGSNGSPISYNTIGTAPNRTFIVQWDKVRRYNSGWQDGDFTFQIRLNESTNVIQIVYGACATTSNTNSNVQVGLRGSSSSDYNNRTTTNNWSATTAGNANNNTCRTNNTTVPSNGQTYTWTPSVCTPSSFTTGGRITSAKLNTLENTTTRTANYHNFASPTTTLVRGQNYTISVKGSTNGDRNYFYTAFVDWNKDNDFNDANEYYVIGTIKNSNGTDGKNASVYFPVPSGATLGSTRMRIIGRYNGYNTTPCGPDSGNNGSTEGQVEDYTITVGDVCSGTPAVSTTITSATPVCPSTPFTLSLGTTFTDGATYVWQTSPDGNNPWTNATATPIAFFGPETFASGTLPTNTQISPNTTFTGGEAVLTTASQTGTIGDFLINKSPGSNLNAFTVDFNYKAAGGGGGTTTGADGFSLSYAGGLTNSVGGGENGEGSGIIVQFDTYDNDGVANGTRVRVLYNNIAIFTSAINAPFDIRNATSTTTAKNVVLTVDNNGFLSLSMVNSSNAVITVVSNLLLPAAYLSADKSSWKFKFSARVGAINDRHTIDDLQIRYLDVSSSKSTFTTSQTVKTYYRALVTCGGTTASSPVLVDLISATIDPMTSPACSATAFTVTPTNGTNGTIPGGTTFTWSAPTITTPGALTGGTASTGTPNGNITGTLTNTTSIAQTATYSVTPTTAGCVGIPFNLVVTVAPATVAGSVGGGTTVCTGTNSTVLTLSGHTGSIIRWESSLDNFATAGTPFVNTATTFTATNLTATTSYRAVVQSGSCATLNSAATTVTVSPTHSCRISWWWNNSMYRN